MLIVYHQVAGRQRQRVDGVAALCRQPLAVDGGGPAACQIRFGDDNQVGAGYHNAAVQRPLQHPDDTALGSGARIQHGGRGVGLGQPLHHPVRGAGSRRHHHGVPAGRDVGAQHREDGFNIVLMTARRRRGPDVQLGRRFVAELAQRPPRMAGPGRRGPDVVQFGESRSAQLRHVDGRIAAQRGHRPGRLQEFTAGLDQVSGPGAHLFRVAQQHGRALGQLFDQEAVGPIFRGPQHRQERLHPVDGDALGQLGQHLGDTAADGGFPCRPLRGRLRDQFGGPGPHVVGEQQFAARHRDQRLDLDFGDGALIGDREHPHFGDLVTPELDTHRVLGRRGENIENPAADGELSAPADHIHPGICQLNQPGNDFVEADLLTDPQGHRFLMAQPRRHWLQQRARRGHHHPQRRPQPGVVGIDQPAQHHQASADGVDAGREPLVRQGFPRREDGHRTAENAAQFSGEVVGFAPGGGDHQQGTLLRQRTGHEQPRTGGADQAQFGGYSRAGLDELLEGRRRERQFNEPRDWGFWASRPRCGHDAAILRGHRAAPNFVNIEQGVVKGS